MFTIRLGAILAPLVLCGFAPQEATAPSTPSTAPAAESYEVHCEVWTATDPELVSALEAHASADAEDALERLRGADAGARRLVRVLSPIEPGSQAQFVSRREVPMTTITASGSGKTQESFSGYTSEGTSVVLRCRTGARKSVTTSLSLEVSDNEGDAGAASQPGIPPVRQSIDLNCEVPAAAGELRMLQFQTSAPGTLVVFVRATAL